MLALSEVYIVFNMIFTKQQLNEGCLKSDFKVKQTLCEILIFLCTHPATLQHRLTEACYS